MLLSIIASSCEGCMLYAQQRRQCQPNKSHAIIACRFTGDLNQVADGR